MNVFNIYLKREESRVLAEKYFSKRPYEEVKCLICGSDRAKLWYQMGYFDSLICKNCGCKYISPRYDDSQLDAHYSKELFTQSKDYEGVQHNMLDEKERARKRLDMKEEIDETVRRCPPGGKVLDVGCQTGIYLEALSDSIKKFGIERCAWAAEHTRKITEAEIVIGKVEEVNYPLEYFDVINMSYVVEHLQYPVNTLKKIVTWLKKDGTLIISVPNFNSLCARIFREFYRLADPRQHIFLTTPSSLKRLFSGFQIDIEKIYYPYFGTHYCRVSEQIRLIANAIRRYFLPILLRIGNTPEVSKLVSPPFYGNIMTVISVKR